MVPKGSAGSSASSCWSCGCRRAGSCPHQPAGGFGGPLSPPSSSLEPSQLTARDPQPAGHVPTSFLLAPLLPAATRRSQILLEAAPQHHPSISQPCTHHPHKGTRWVTRPCGVSPPFTPKTGAGRAALGCPATAGDLSSPCRLGSFWMEREEEILGWRGKGNWAARRLLRGVSRPAGGHAWRMGLGGEQNQEEELGPVPGQPRSEQPPPLKPPKSFGMSSSEHEGTGGIAAPPCPAPHNLPLATHPTSTAPPRVQPQPPGCCVRPLGAVLRLCVWGGDPRVRSPPAPIPNAFL